jgi:glycosyltransferase involved in cell wall biosynthesis
MLTGKTGDGSADQLGLLPRRSPFLVIIPAFNEQQSIEGVVRDVRRHLPQADVLVIDDGSTDNTAELSRNTGADVLVLPCNLGIGGAVQTGLKFAEKRGYPFVIRLDGDGQHDAGDIQELLAEALRGEHNVVVGSRFVDGKSDYRPPLTRRIGIRLFSYVVSVIIGKRVYDTTSGMMVLDRKAVRALAHSLPQDYPEVESHIILHKAGLSTVEIPVQMRVRSSGVSSIGAARAIYYVLKVMLAAVLRALQRGPQTPR